MKKIMLLLLITTSVWLMSEVTEFDAGSIQMSWDEDDGDIIVSKETGDDFFGGGKTVRFTGIADDLYLMGKTVSFDGESSGGVMAFGDSVELNGIITKNLHSAGNTVTINGHLKETSFIGGQDIIISEDAIIDGTLITGSNSLNIKGQVNNGIISGAGEVVIDGPVKGDVELHVGKLIITERGSISGNLTYESGSEISEKEMSRVSGIISFEEDDDDVTVAGLVKFGIFMKVWMFAAVIITGLLLLLFPGIKNLAIGERESKKYLRTMLWGLIPVFIFPVLLIFTLPVLPLSIGLLLSLFPLWGITTVLGIALGGQFIFKLFNWDNNNVYIHYLVGFGIFIILGNIPFIGTIVMLAISAIGAGVLIEKLFNTEL